MTTQEKIKLAKGEDTTLEQFWELCGESSFKIINAIIENPNAPTEILREISNQYIKGFAMLTNYFDNSGEIDICGIINHRNISYEIFNDFFSLNEAEEGEYTVYLVESPLANINLLTHWFDGVERRFNPAVADCRGSLKIIKAILYNHNTTLDLINNIASSNYKKIANLGKKRLKEIEPLKTKGTTKWSQHK